MVERPPQYPQRAAAAPAPLVQQPVARWLRRRPAPGRQRVDVDRREAEPVGDQLPRGVRHQSVGEHLLRGLGQCAERRVLVEVELGVDDRRHLELHATVHYRRCLAGRIVCGKRLRNGRVSVRLSVPSINSDSDVHCAG